MVSCHFVHTFIDVWSNLLVVSGDICAFGVVNKLFNIIGDVNVYESTVSADLVAVVHAGRKGAAITNIIHVAQRSVDALS